MSLVIRGIYKTLTDSRLRRDWRFNSLRKMRDWVLPSYRLHWPHMAWWNDQDFNSFLSKFRIVEDAERRWALWQLTRIASSISGDTAECGVWLGSSSYLICKSLGREHFGFDSFEGQSRPSAQDDSYYSAGDMAAPLETAQRNLADFPKAHLLKGWIPERFHEIGDRRFSFVHIDVQFYQPTRDSLEFFYPRLNPGAILICDDYGFTTCPGARQAVDEFLRDKPEEVVELPCGNAFLIRQ